MKNVSVKRNFYYMLVYRIIVTFAPLITTPYIVRILTPTDLGNYNYAESVVAYFSAFAALGCNVYGQREIATHRDNRLKYSQAFWEIMLVRLFMCILVTCIYAGAVILAFDQRLTILYAILGIEMLGGILDVTWLYQGIENYESVFWRNLITRLASIVLIFLLVKQPHDFYKYVVINVLALFIGNITLWFRIREVIAFVPLKRLKPRRRFWPMLVLFLPTVASTIYNKLDITMIGWLCSDPVENAYYAQSLKISTICLTTVSTVSGVVAPRLAYTIANGTKQETDYYMSKALGVIFLIGLPMTVGIMAIADVLVPWFLGESYIPSVTLLRYLAALCLISGLNGLFGATYLVASNRHNEYSITIIIGCLFNFLVNLVLIPRYASKGAAVASVMSECMILAMILLKNRRKIDINGVIPEIVKILCSSVFMGVATYSLSYYAEAKTTSILLLICSGVVIYGICLILLKERTIMDYLNKGKVWLKQYGNKR